MAALAFFTRPAAPTPSLPAPPAPANGSGGSVAQSYFKLQKTALPTTPTSPLPPPSPLRNTMSPTPGCPACGAPVDDLVIALRRIEELESQLRAATADSPADDSALDDQTELAKNGLTASATWPATRPTNNATEHASSATSNFATTATTNTTTQTALQTRFATFLGRRKPIPLVTAQAQDGVAGASSHSVDGRAGSVIVPLPSPPATAALPPSPAISGSSFADHEPGNTSGAPKRDAASDVVAQERSLRYAAQVALSQTQAQLTGSQRELGTVQAELEDLTATLFTQANSMVADERKARARLEDRLTLLETRDRDRGKRLDSLERAVGLVERIRLLVDDG